MSQSFEQIAALFRRLSEWHVHPKLLGQAKRDAEVVRLLKWENLPALIRSAVHADPATPELAQELTERWFSLLACNRVFTTPTDRQREAIVVAAQTRDLPTPFKEKLNRWLGSL